LSMRPGGVLALMDLGSPNGVYFRLRGGLAIDDAPGAFGANGTEIHDQDLFLIGQQVLEFHVVNESEEGFGPAKERGTLLFGTPIAPRFARLCQRSVEGITRDVFHLRKVETVLGRESGDIVFTDDPFLSRRHAMIRAEGVRAEAVRSGSRPKYFLSDLGSSNGTFLKLRAEVVLRSGDEFRVGQQLFRIDGPAPTTRGEFRS
jgi:hypothetical protein